MKIVPAIPEIDPKSLLEMDAGNGPFYFCSAGARQDVSNIVFYGDASHQMLVFTEYVKDVYGDLCVSVFGASTRKWGGQTPRIIRSELNVIENNLTYLFSTRRLWFLGCEIIPSGSPLKVIFSWSLAG